MRVSWETYYDRLGPHGLRLVVALLLDPAALEQLVAGEAGDGSSLEQGQLLADLASEDPELAAQLLDHLDQASEKLEPRPEKWEESRLREALAEMLRSPGPSAATILHRLARAHRSPLPQAEIRAAAELIVPELLDEEIGSRPKWTAKVASSQAGRRELEQERRELETRVRQLESQLSRALERSATQEERLGKRLDENRKLREDLRSLKDERQKAERDALRLKKKVEDLLERRAKERTGEITSALRRLTTEQRRNASLVERLREGERDRKEGVRTQGRLIAELSSLLQQVVSMEEAQARTAAATQAEILRELGTIRDGLAQNGTSAKKPRRSRIRGEDEPRVGVFVDVQNMFYGAREKGARLDFLALLSTACTGRHLVRAVAYLVETKEIDQSAFIHLLQTKAYEVKRKPLRIRQDRSAKGNWDLEMALDALSTAEHLDIVVLVTGDGDFVPLVRDLKLKGKRVEVYGFTASSAPDLREAADRFFNITRRLLRAPKPRK